MKSAAKFFLFLQFVYAAFLIIFLFQYVSILDKIKISLNLKQEITSFVVNYPLLLAIKIILILSISITAFCNLDTVSCKKEINGIAVATLLFVSFIAGILMLCLSDDDFTSTKQHEQMKPRAESKGYALNPQAYNLHNATTEKKQSRKGYSLRQMAKAHTIATQAQKKLQKEVVEEKK